MTTPLRLFYHALFCTAYPVLVALHLPGLFSRSTEKRARARGKLGWWTPAPCDLWIHAVSGGEALLAKTLLEMLPGQKVLITTQSDTGMQTLQRLFGGASDSPRTQIAWFPYDCFPFMRRFLGAARPKRLFIIEHDLWPGLLSMARRRGIPTALLNAFLKPKDRAWLGRIPFLAPLLYGVDEIFTASGEQAAEFRAFLPQLPITITGNLKYRLRPAAEGLRVRFPRKACVVFGSSHAPEERLAVDALAGVSPEAVLVLIPRHPDRARELEREFSPSHRVAVWSDLLPGEEAVRIPPETEILIVDRMGLTHLFYRHADLVLIGDTFRPSQGGHNFLEPLLYAKPVVYGDEMKSFPDITPLFESRGGVRRIPPRDLKRLVGELLSDGPKRRKMGEIGHELLKGLEFDQALFLARLSR